MMGKNQHVVPHKDGWAVKGAGNQKATRVVSTQREAINIAQDIARNQHSDTKIHGENGRIRAGNSYGNDPCPPKDKK
ncbi:hypothetical protein HMPREF9016_00220 [Neisseria sp. oral taxon 014 str. F0314]|uniref:DUF2188 domain-containing protein n=1 Tax=Neisseria TaxID=482 RepID=UPI0001D8C0C9|nr:MULTISPECIES: DUF2188 domain-containing protein [Neisseria]EFI24044.1 hypothetical protein HMPREF9016_00220 [Neisseria sp. oral taxon 014 str. F0314]